MRSFFERIMVMIPSIVLVVDLRNRRIIWCNQLARDFVGQDLVAMGDDAVKHLRDLIHPDDRDSIDPRRERVASLADEDIESYEFRARNTVGEWRWFAAEDRVCGRDDDGKAILTVTSAIDITEQKRREEHQRLIALELDHRVKNTLSIIQSIANRTAKSDENRRFGEDLMKRIQGLVASQDALHLDEAPSVELRDLIRCQIETFSDLPVLNVTYRGPDARIRSGIFQTVGMGFHELLRNAHSHGALSVTDGEISIEWQFFERDGREFLQIDWRESGGSEPSAGSTLNTGFGNIILNDVLPTVTGGKANLDMSSDGVRWVLTAPAAQVIQP